jgi:hypothetical protein
MRLPSLSQSPKFGEHSGGVEQNLLRLRLVECLYVDGIEQLHDGGRGARAG